MIYNYNIAYKKNIMYNLFKVDNMKKGIKDEGKETRKIIFTGLGFVFGVFCLALCYNLFFVPNNLVVGGVSGVAILVQKLTSINGQLFIYVVSFILLIISYLFLGKEETERILIGTLLYPLFITFTYPLAIFLIKYLSFQEILVTVISASLLYGFSNGLIYRVGYSTGGSDVIIKIMCKYFHITEGKGFLIFNIIVIIFGAFIFGVDTAVYAAIILVISSLIVDKISIGISDSKKFIIYTRKLSKVTKVITDNFNTGYTIFPTIGGYSHTKGSMIMCIIRNRDVGHFKEKILNIDSQAFFVISDCYEVQGGVKKSNIPFI